MIRRIIRHIWRSVALLLVNKVFVGTNVHYFAVKRLLLRSIGHKIGEATKIVGPLYCTGRLELGTECWIGANFTVRGNGTVMVGDRVDIGPDVTFLTGTHQIGEFQRRAGDGYNCNQNIGSGCWIGGKTVFVNNISIGEACVVAASACVCKNTPPQCANWRCAC